MHKDSLRSNACKAILAKLFYRLQAFAQEMANEPQLPTEENMPGTSNVYPLEAFQDKKLHLVVAARFIPAGKLP